MRGAERLVVAAVLLGLAVGAGWGLDNGLCCAVPMAAFAVLLVVATWTDSRRGYEVGPFTRDEEDDSTP